MPISDSQARKIGNEWLRKQTNIPKGAVCFVGPYKVASQCRKCEIRIQINDYELDPKPYILVKLRINDDRSLHVNHDRREWFDDFLKRRNIDLTEQGPEKTYTKKELEDRFDDMLDRSEFPDCVLDIRPSEDSDPKGVIAIVILRKKNTRVVNVPIYAFASRVSKRDFCYKLGPNAMSTAVTLVLTPDKTDEIIAQDMTRRLLNLYKLGG